MADAASPAAAPPGKWSLGAKMAAGRAGRRSSRPPPFCGGRRGRAAPGPGARPVKPRSAAAVGARAAACGLRAGRCCRRPGGARSGCIGLCSHAPQPPAAAPAAPGPLRRGWVRARSLSPPCREPPRTPGPPAAPGEVPWGEAMPCCALSPPCPATGDVLMPVVSNPALPPGRGPSPCSAPRSHGLGTGARLALGPESPRLRFPRGNFQGCGFGDLRSFLHSFPAWLRSPAWGTPPDCARLKSTEKPSPLKDSGIIFPQRLFSLNRPQLLSLIGTHGAAGAGRYLLASPSSGGWRALAAVAPFGYRGRGGEGRSPACEVIKTDSKEKAA